MVQLLDRDGDLERIGAAIAAARVGAGGLVLIEGSPGIGKTALLAAARDRARAGAMAVRSTRASRLDADLALGVLARLLEAPAAARHDDVPVAHLDALCRAVADLAARGPLALAVDDAHWADPSSLRVLELLLPRLDGLPLLLLLAARPRPAGAQAGPLDRLATDAAATVLHPAPLGEDAVAALAGPELAAVCAEATGGNPYLLHELLAALPSGASPEDVRRAAPAGVARAVVVAVEPLGPDAAALARALAVLGDGAPLRRAAALAGLAPERAGDLAVALARAGVLAADRLAFAQPILRAAVLADLPAVERARAHRRAADLLEDEDEDAAEHLLHTEPAGDPHVVEALEEAAEQALASGAAQAAARCLQRAVAEPPPPEERGRVLLALASAELRAGDPAAAAEHFEAGARLARDPRTRAAVAWEHAVALQSVGRHDEAFALRQRAVAAVDGIDGELALALEAGLVASARLDQSRLAWARERLERDRGRLGVETPGEARLLAMQAHLDAFSSGGGSAAEVAATAERALHSGRLVDEGRPSSAFFAAVEVLMLADRAEPARRALDELADAARRRDSAPSFAAACAWRCLLHARAGALHEAEADARRCAELSLPHGWFHFAPLMLGFVLDALVDRGAYDDAEQVLGRSGMAARPAGHDLAFDPVVAARARLRAARGDVAAARGDLGALARREARWNTFPALVPPVLVAPAAAGRPEEAREHAARALEEAHGWGTPRAVGMALRAAALAEGGRRGLALLEDAAATLEGSPARLEHARALADLGGALRRANRRSAAREPLRRALDLADACGAVPLAAHVRQQLRAAGGRPRRPRIAGVDALTASERRVADMAAGGLSNPEIAQALFVTTKTVETHLRNAYRKLEIRSRSELARVLAPGGV